MICDLWSKPGQRFFSLVITWFWTSSFSSSGTWSHLLHTNKAHWDKTDPSRPSIVVFLTSFSNFSSCKLKAPWMKRKACTKEVTISSNLFTNIEQHKGSARSGRQSVTVTVSRDRNIQTAQRTSRTVGFVTVLPASYWELPFKLLPLSLRLSKNSHRANSQYMELKSV